MKTYSEFHDGFLEGLHIDRDAKVARVFLRTLEGQRASAVLNGVVMLKADGFREGNIIFDVSTRDSDEITLADIEQLYELDSSREPATWESKLMDRVKDEGLQILAVNPSYGGNCLVLAQKIEFATE